MSDKKICSLTIFDCYISERDRTMLFPDSFFFAERRLLNHKIETKYVKDLDHCELFCYMNDNCVSANFKKDPEDGGIDYICELNNATHLEYDTDLITNADFYYRGSKVKYTRRFSMNREKQPTCTKTSVLSFIYQSIYQSIHPSLFFKFCFFQNACGKNLPCQNNATCQSGFTIKGYRCSCPLGFEGEHCEKG